MEKLDDETLARLSAQNHESAFAELVRRYERQLVSLIQYQLGDLDHAEDVLQETLLQAWLGIAHLREPKAIGAWLLRIARNRCYDFLKSAQRRDLTIEREELTQLVNRFGHRQIRQRQIFDDAVEALEQTPESEREVARLFYLQGFTISEIAERHHCPEGTVKRRLFHARAHLRQSFGISDKRRMSQMHTRKPGTKKQPFPLRRPEIVITKINTAPFSVDCPELRWWFIVPKVGEHALYANYEPPDWKVTEVHEMHAVRPASVHDLDGVEIDISTWNLQTGWMPSAWQMYGRLTDEKAVYLAVSNLQDDKRVLYTFLDKYFDVNWGQMPRQLGDQARFVSQADSSLKQAHSVDDPQASGAGVFSVKVGDRDFTCLRVFQLEGAVTELDAPITESYVTQAGRTVMVRHFCHPEKAMLDDQGNREGVVVDDHVRIVIDGVTFVHWYDSFSNLAFGF